VVYLGHLPYGFQEQQLTSYFSQYGDVLGVKVARSKKTARSKGYAFIQFRYP
jgi:nucleolar protein 15